MDLFITTSEKMDSSYESGTLKSPLRKMPIIARKMHALNQLITSLSIWFLPICQLLKTRRPPNNPASAPKTNTSLERAIKLLVIWAFEALISAIPGGVPCGKEKRQVNRNIRQKRGSIFKIFIRKPLLFSFRLHPILPMKTRRRWCSLLLLILRYFHSTILFPLCPPHY